MEQPQEGSLTWRLSSHPITLLCFLSFRLSSLLVYLLGGLFGIDSFILIFIITILLLAADFYYLKNIAGRRLVGLRWWNESSTSNTTSSGNWVFESADPRPTNATDRRFFWLALYAQPALWVALAIVDIMTLKFVWLILVVIAMVLTGTNALAFSRCDKFSQATGIAGSVMGGGGLAGRIASGMLGRVFGGR